MDVWTVQRVLQLAGDAGSAKAGQDLGQATSWQSTGSALPLIWGLCQGSGVKPYQVRVDLCEPAFKCSCPSRKFPCKHAIGLMLVHANGAITGSNPPPWAQEWIDTRVARSSKPAKDRPVAPVDEESQRRRRAQRLDRIQAGLRNLREWLSDLVTQGLAQVPSLSADFFEIPARRMVDAQAPGAARLIRHLGAISHSSVGWQASFVAKMGQLHLLIEAFDKLDSLPGETRDDVLAALGVPQSAANLINTQPAVSDTWQIISQEVEIEERLRSQRTWLRGVSTGRSAKILNFAFGSAPLDTTLIPGTQFHGDLCFFPGNDFRAQIKSRSAPATIRQLRCCLSLDELCEQFSLALSRQPWIDEQVLPVSGLVIHRAQDRWVLADRNSSTLPPRWSERAAWTSLAISGGHPADLVLGFDGRALRPLAIFAEGRFVSLTSTEA